MAKTSEGLVEFAKKALSDGWRYWYGTTGVRCTPQLLTRKTAQYPAHYKSSRMTRYNRDIAEGRYCADCIGLAKGYMWRDEKTGAQRYKSNDCPDASANGMYNRAVEKGGIASMPEIPGLMLHMDGHAGIYIGGGQVVEARGFNYGVVRTELKKRPWKHWYKLPGCAYAEKDPGAGAGESEGNPYPEPVKNLRRGAVGDTVKWVQWELLRRGYDLGSDGIDGEFGKATESALKAFQRDNGLTVDGIAGKNTFAALDKRLPESGEAEEDSEKPETVTIAPGTWHVRMAPRYTGAVLGYAHGGDVLERGKEGWTTDSWLNVIYAGESAWIGGKAVDK